MNSFLKSQALQGHEGRSWAGQVEKIVNQMSEQRSAYTVGEHESLDRAL